MNNNYSQSDVPFDEFVVDESMIRSVMYGEDLSTDDLSTEDLSNKDQRNNPDAEYVKDLRELDDVLKEQGHQAIAELWTPYDFGFDYERGDKDNRNRLEEAMTKLEKVLSEDIVVPGCALAECKRTKDGVRIKAYWAEPEYDERGRRAENHILLHACKYTFPNYDVPQIVVLCIKRGGDIFPHIDIVKQLKEKIGCK